MMLPERHLAPCVLVALLALVAMASACKRPAPEITYRYEQAVPPAGAAEAAPVVAPAAGPMALHLDGSPSKGPLAAKVTIVEVSDFQ